MDQTWIAFEYDHQKKCWQPSKNIRKMYRTVGHIKAALTTMLTSGDGWNWEIVYESPNLIECVMAHYIENPALGRNEDDWGFRRERHVSTGPRLVFVEITSRLDQDLFPTPPPLPDESF